MINQLGTLIVQGFGHAQFRDGFRCALYRDDNGNIYAKPELFTINEMIMFHGAWVHIDPMNSNCYCTTCNQSKQ